MTGYLTKLIDRQLRRVTLITVLGGTALLTTTALAARRFHDTNLDLAAVAVEKAQGLVALTQCGNPGERTTEACEKELKKAEDLLAKAYAALVAAALASDGGTSSH